MNEDLQGLSTESFEKSKYCYYSYKDGSKIATGHSFIKMLYGKEGLVHDKLSHVEFAQDSVLTKP